jgi:hypothetical protein
VHQSRDLRPGGGAEADPGVDTRNHSGLNAILANSSARLDGHVFAVPLPPSGEFLAVMLFF